MAWPPTLAELKSDLKIDDDRDDDALSTMLAAAVGFVEHVRGSAFNFVGDPISPLPDPTAEIALGTVRLAGRWHVRRRSPDGLILSGEFGTSRIPSFDPDIERLLGIGRYRDSVVA